VGRDKGRRKGEKTGGDKQLREGDRGRKEGRGGRREGTEESGKRIEAEISQGRPKALPATPPVHSFPCVTEQISQRENEL